MKKTSPFHHKWPRVIRKARRIVQQSHAWLLGRRRRPPETDADDLARAVQILQRARELGYHISQNQKV
jgi:hypothetical protein